MDVLPFVLGPVCALVAVVLLRVGYWCGFEAAKADEMVRRAPEAHPADQPE